MKYLITGGLGLIGSHLANKLKGEITIINRTDRHRDRIENKKVNIVIKSLQEITTDDLKNIDIIYHCASTVDNYHILTDPYIDVETNIKSTIHLLELCKALPKKPKIIYLSTFFVYGNEYEPTKKAITEQSKTDPLALYPITKLATESIIKLYSKMYNIPFIIARLTNVYSDREDYTNKKKGAFNYLLMEMVKGRPINVYKGGNFVRDYIFDDDVVSALQVIEKQQNETYLIGYGTPIEFRTMIEHAHKLTGNASKITEVDPPEFHKIVGINSFVADVSKIHKLGWKAKIDPKKGVEKVISRYQQLL